MPRNMQFLYQTMTDKHLREIRSKKYVRLLKVVDAKAWWDTREKEMLENTIKQIDAELAYRAARVALL